ncbi:MAG TPA: hypothetical protein VFA75_14790 [Nevskia sp.]|jgi:hypothetical protein|nr:hypothetical protein [Nevskia sp.]
MTAPDMEALLRHAREQERLERLRSGHQALVYAVILNVLSLLLFKAGIGLLLLLGLAAVSCGIAGTIRVVAALDYSATVKNACVLAQALPVLSILALLWLGREAAEQLRGAGFEVGWLGAAKRGPLPLPAAAPAEPPPPAGPVMPRIKTPAFIGALLSQPGLSGEQTPVTQRLPGDLLVAFSIDVGTSFMFLTPAECARRGLKKDELLQLARRNAARGIATLQIKRSGEVFQLAAGEQGKDLEACSILFPEFWKQVAARLKDAPLAIFPHRNAVYFTAAGSATGAAALQAIVAGSQFRQAHALSRLLYVFREGQWAVFEPGPKPGAAQGSGPSWAEQTIPM